MSAAVWDRRRRVKRFRLEIERALKIVLANRDAVVPLGHSGLMVISMHRYEGLRSAMTLQRYEDMQQAALQALSTVQ